MAATGGAGGGEWGAGMRDYRREGSGWRGGELGARDVVSRGGVDKVIRQKGGEHGDGGAYE
ncbi:hypothetical protein A6V37_37995 [Paraburkholderia ginsengiterrae]|uniref:Uncharacterized protein n=1 Tax=Paraburkholderia ginsengiterrae TaxID=1462993 RepID=A0A1A9NA81_9BURK|nr:hypothetical protein A6V37_37995 [Paraburkholderia ginsengiterrae]